MHLEVHEITVQASAYILVFFSVVVTFVLQNFCCCFTIFVLFFFCETYCQITTRRKYQSMAEMNFWFITSREDVSHYLARVFVHFTYIHPLGNSLNLFFPVFEPAQTSLFIHTYFCCSCWLSLVTKLKKKGKNIPTCVYVFGIRKKSHFKMIYDHLSVLYGFLFIFINIPTCIRILCREGIYYNRPLRMIISYFRMSTIIILNGHIYI